jgi:hypothetical protein
MTLNKQDESSMNNERLLVVVLCLTCAITGFVLGIQYEKSKHDNFRFHPNNPGVFIPPPPENPYQF